MSAPGLWDTTAPWWGFGALLLATFALMLVPGYLVLALGGYRAGRHWSQNARPMTTLRGLVLSQPPCLGVALVIAIPEGATVFERVLAFGMLAGGWMLGARLLGTLAARAHAFPKPVVRFEQTRSMLCNVFLAGSVFFPALTRGLDFSTQVVTCVWSAGVLVWWLFATATLFRLFGLLEPLPVLLQQELDRKAPHVRGAAFRTIAANAFALPFERMVLFTTGALQVLSDAERVAILAHELAHLRESLLVYLVRILPRVLLVSVIILVVLVPGRGAAWILGAFVAYYVALWVARRVGVAKESAADVAGVADEENAGDYARGLLALYSAYLMPATMRWGTHPNLHDRLREAGVEPDFEKPKPPAIMPIYVVGLVSAVVMVKVVEGVLWRREG